MSPDVRLLAFFECDNSRRPAQTAVAGMTETGASIIREAAGPVATERR
jgi:hypothetical protein